MTTHPHLSSIKNTIRIAQHWRLVSPSGVRCFPSHKAQLLDDPIDIFTHLHGVERILVAGPDIGQTSIFAPFQRRILSLEINKAPSSWAKPARHHPRSKVHPGMNEFSEWYSQEVCPTSLFKPGDLTDCRSPQTAISPKVQSTQSKGSMNGAMTPSFAIVT